MSNKPNLVPQNLVDELRSQFLCEVEEKGFDSVHPKDLERVKTDDFWLKRFIAHNENDISLARKMMWNSLTWRKDFQVNEISESNLNLEILKHGGFFPHGRDIDGKTLFIIKGNKHIKGVYDSHEIKRCVVYWFERIEKMTKGDVITLFFDMDGSGLKNTDMDFMKFLIGLFKEYYPFFLNYILILEMPWVLNAAFRVIKSWLPEKAVEKIKFLSKKDITNFVPTNEALTCWGGTDDYEFKFIPDQIEQNQNKENRKVHFSEGTPMPNDTSNNHNNQRKEDGPLKVIPSGLLMFVEQGSETSSTVELTNTDSNSTIAFKLKTTSPEKFRVKPSTGTLTPNDIIKVTVTLLPGFQLGGLAKEKFLVMSTVIEQDEELVDLTEFWKNTADKKVYQQRLKCMQNEETNKPSSPPQNNDALVKLGVTLRKIEANQQDLSCALKTTHRLLTALLVWSVFITVAIFYGFYYKNVEGFSDNPYCPSPESPM